MLIMKTKTAPITIGISLFLAGILCTAGCKKEAGVIGKKIISGVVYYKNGVSGADDPAPSAIVFITYGATEATGSYNQTTTTNSNGEYKIKGLQKGNYFVTAEYTDTHGFKYATYGYAVQINNKKSELKLDIRLQ
ncbi:MAG: carboxypeptidase regulatory-like domain-containing protein [Bacteroidetes bacterium]|nr:MAG: carboxypeptidase regulatory-like domain-containing protein [Bacteroidota bacterium]